MADSAVAEQMLSIPQRAAAVAKGGVRDTRFRALTFIAALLVLFIFAGVMASLIDGAMPAIKAFGWSFLSSTDWNPVTQKFGALPSIYGTLVSSFLAMFLAVPIGIGIAIFLTEICPRPLRRPIGIAIELLAGIPSIIYGIWGLFIFAPWFQEHVQTWLTNATGVGDTSTVDGSGVVLHAILVPLGWLIQHLCTWIPFLGDIFAGPPYGIGLFTASLILSIMILPFISSVTRDVFETVPHMLKEAAYGLGCTTWEVMWRVVLPFARTGVVGGAMLALGRALGETMAVTFVIGNDHHIHESLFAPATTISASIANEFTEAVGDLYTSSLIELGLILFFITFVVLASAQLMLYALERRAGGAS
ncbi:MAG TPA: ABC transporter permease subunit [Rhizomicrobium sp.]|nr:ABC transporter permease subunit [Rhizomicrobium sp.]